MRQKNLSKMIVLSLALATVSMGAYAASYTNGTHDIGGDYTTSGHFANSTGNLTLNATNDVQITETGSGYVIFAPAKTTNNAKLTVNMNNKNLTTNGVGFLSGNGYIDFEPPSGYDISVTNADNLTSSTRGECNNIAYFSAGTVSLQANNNINLTATDWPNISLESNAKGILTAGNNITITTLSNPINIYDSIGTSKIDVIANQNVVFNSTGSHSGLYVYGKNSLLNVIAKNGTINMNSTGGNKAAVNDDGGTINLTAEKDITVGSNAKIGLKANGTGVINATSTSGNIVVEATNTSGNNNAAIYAVNKGTVNLHSDTTVSAVTDGVQADGGAVTFDKNATIKDAATGIASSNQGTVTVNGDATITSTVANITADNGTVTLAKAATLSGAPTAIAASNGGKVTATDASSAKKITGNITSDGTGSSVDANFMTSDSYLTGATTVSNDGAVNLEFGNGGTWNVTGDSSLTNLTNNSNGVIDMGYTGAGNYNTITTQNYTGNGGTIIMDTDLQKSKDTYDVRQNSDKLVINGTSSGTTYITIKDASKLAHSPAEGYVLLVEDKTSGGATFEGKSLEDSGIYKYKPVITDVNPADNYGYTDGPKYTGYTASNAKNWYLASFTRDGLQPAVVPDITAGTEKYINYRHELDNLLLRLGELRDYENSDGIWARIKHSTGSAKDYGIGSNQFTMYQLGYDHRYRNDPKNGREYFGVAFDYMLGTQNYDTVNADSKNHTYSLSLYNTWLGTKGHYLDLIGKVGRINRDFNYHGAYADSGSDQSWYYSLSAEYGRKIMNDKGLYWEPQTQLTYGHINGSDYTTDKQGIAVESDGINSLIWRVGTTFGKHFGGNVDGHRSNVYAKIFWNREFLGNSDGNLAYYTDAYDYTNHYRGNWWTIGIGANWQLDTKTNAYIDLSKDFGGDFNNKYQLNVGIRWSWGGASKKAVAAPVPEPIPTPAPAPVVAPQKEAYVDSIHFNFDEDQPQTAEEYKIKKFADAAKANPEATYAMVGNTDSIGADSYNMDLSKRRVENVKTKAINLGVPANRMEDSYLGKSHPVESNDTDEGRAANRRVDIYEHTNA